MGAPTGQLNIATVYTTGACAKCARYVARIDSGKCEWCSRPWRPMPKKKPSKKGTA